MLNSFLSQGLERLPILPVSVSFPVHAIYDRSSGGLHMRSGTGLSHRPLMTYAVSLSDRGEMTSVTAAQKSLDVNIAAAARPGLEGSLEFTWDTKLRARVGAYNLESLQTCKEHRIFPRYQHL